MDREESVTRSLLMGLSDDGLEEVLSAFQPRAFDAGATIVRAGDAGDELFLITTGRVRVWSGDGPAVAERTLSMMGPGEHFGEASVIAGSPRTATVTAVTFVETMVLAGDDYRRLVKDYPQLLENLSRSLTRRLSRMNVTSDDRVNSKRGIHTLAIVIDHAAGWALAEGLLGQLRTTQIVQPMVVSGEASVTAERFDHDAISVAPTDLGHTIARQPRDTLAVAVAEGTQAADAAVQQSNRVIFVTDAKSRLTDHASKLLDSIPIHRRPIVALMFDALAKPRPEMKFPHGLHVRCSYRTRGTQIEFDPASVIRLYRSLIGKRIGLALGGGGARGIAHIGVLEVLREHRVVFDSIAGTSAGAIIAAAYGAGFEPNEIGEFFRQEMVPPKYLAGRAATRRMFLLHRFRGGRFETKLRRYLGQLTFDQANLPLAITTLDLISGEQQIRRQGDLVTSVLQSINHPVFGRPIISDGQMLVDGGVLMNVPASVLRGEGCNHVISIDVGSTLATDYGIDRSGKLKTPSYLSTLLRTMDISRRHSSALHREESDLIIIPETSDYRIEDFHAVDPLIQAGRRAGESAVDNVKRVIENLEPTTDLFMNSSDHSNPPSADTVLITKIREGDGDAWQALIDRYEGRLLAYTRSRIRDSAAAEDIVQEAFVGFLISLPNYDGGRPLESYLFSICAYKLTDHLRREGRRPSLQLHGRSSSAGEMEFEGSARVASSIARSVERKNIEQNAIREAISDQISKWKSSGNWIKLKAIELIIVRGWGNKQVAEDLGLSEQQVANYKSDFQIRLRSIIKRSDLDESVFPELADES